MKYPIVVNKLPETFSSLETVFDKYINIFGIHIFATVPVPDDKMLHAANVMAQYLDNNGDGEVDNPLIIKSLLDVPMKWRPGDEPDEKEMEHYKNIKLQSAIYMSNDEDEQSKMRRKLADLNDEGDEIYIEQVEKVIHGGGQDLMASETGNNIKHNGKDMFDASLEEILHLISSNGYAYAYPEIFGENKDSEISKLMDKARGGSFEDVPDNYPNDAWYTYSDKSCDYGCQITEYFYWGLLTLLNPDPRKKDFWKNRGELRADLQNEWKIRKTDGSLMTLEERDPELYNLLNKKFALPTKIPDGNYILKEKTFLTKNEIETKYKEAYNKIYAKWGDNFDAVNNERGRNILLELYNNVPDTFSGSIEIVYDLTTPFYKGSGGSYGYTPYVPPPTPVPSVQPSPQPTTKKEQFNFTKSDIYTDLAYSFRVSSEAENNMELYKHNIVHFYELALDTDKDNWRPIQYYGIYFAKSKNVVKAKEYLKRLKQLLDNKNEKYDKSSDEWYNAVNHFQKEIDIAINLKLSNYKKNVIELLQLDKENSTLQNILQEINSLLYRQRQFIEETIETKLENIKQMKKFTELSIDIEQLNDADIEFDFIIIGGGPSGIMCAHRLSKLNPNKKIIIFEKNKKTIKDYTDKQYTKIKNWILASGDPDYLQVFNSKPDMQNKNKMYQIQLGKGLGGGTLHFGLQYIDQTDIMKSSSNFRRESDFEIFKDIHTICKTKSYNYNNMPLVLSNLKDMLTKNANSNYNIYNNKIYSRDLETRFLLYDILKDRNNITVCYDKHIRELTFQNIGDTTVKNNIKNIIMDNTYFNVNPGKQVILCAGALETPAILQRSLVIKQETLDIISKNNNFEAKIDTLVNLPVGDTLYDHGGVSLVYMNREETYEKKKVLLNTDFIKRVNEIINNVYILTGYDIPYDDYNKIWDFTNWVSDYSGKTPLKNLISDDYILDYDLDIYNWNQKKHLVKEIGVYNSEIYYDDFPSYLKNIKKFEEAFKNGFNTSTKKYKGWNVINDIKNNYYFDKNIDDKTKTTIIDDLKNLENIVGNYGTYDFYGFLQGGYTDTQTLIDKKNSSYQLYLQLARSVNYGRKLGNFYKYEFAHKVFKPIWYKILSLGTALPGLYMDPKNLNTRKEEEGIKIIYQGVNIGTRNGANELSRIRLDIAKEYFNMYRISHKLEKQNEELIPAKLINSITALFTILWAQENEITKNGKKITLTDELLRNDTLWKWAYLISLSKNNLYLLLNRFIKEVYNSKNWEILFSQLFNIYYDTFIKDFEEFMKKDINIRLMAVNNNIIDLKSIFSKQIFTRIKSKKISDISSNIIGHIQTRGNNNKWQAYYSLIPRVNQLTYNVEDTLQPIVILTCAEASNMKPSGFVRIPDFDKTSNPRVCLNYNINDIYDAFITNHNSISTGNDGNKLGEFYLTDPSLNILLNVLLDEETGLYGIDISGIKKHFNQNYLNSIYHYHGSCPFGAVVDSGQRVYTFDNLSIGDLSVLSLPFPGSTSVPAMVCGYKCANNLSGPKTRNLKLNNYDMKNAFLDLNGFERNKIPVLSGENGEKTLYCKVETELVKDSFFVRSNGVPNYKPNVGGNEIIGSWKDELKNSTDNNPNYIGEQNWIFEIPVLDPTVNPIKNEEDDLYKVYETNLNAIGVASNGIPFFNPWHNVENTFLSKTRDATTFATFSSCCGHPARNQDDKGGAYHYHKYPTCVAGNMGLSTDNSIIEEENMADVLDDKLKVNGKDGHSSILGYMLDGYPVYGPIGTTELVYTESIKNKILTSSYKLNTYNNEYEYVKNYGDLDKCNAIYSATPEYPLGCYHYVLSIEKNKDNKCKRTVQPLYIYKDNENIPMITTSYPHTTLYYRGKPNKIKKLANVPKKLLPDRTRNIVDINEFKNGINVEYANKDNNLIFNFNKNKQYGVYSQNGTFAVIDGELVINKNDLSENTDIYIWEKQKKIKMRNINIEPCKYEENKLALKRGKTRSFAGIKYITSAEHNKLSNLVRSILGRTVWATNTLYVILTSGYGVWSDNEKFLIDSALKLYENVSQLKFTYTEDWDLADIEIKRQNVHPSDEKIVGSSWGPTVYGTEINIYTGAYRSNANEKTPKGGYIGGWDYATFIHEIGHSLGLMHPHEEIEGSIRMKNVWYNPMNGKFIRNNRANAFPFTVMSYNDITSIFTPNNTTTYGFMNSLGVIDIAAIQAVYGVNTTYNAKDNIYKFDNKNNIYTGWGNIYDTGGTDEINAEEAVSNVLINLKTSDINDDTGKKLHLSKAENIWGGFSIFSQSKIENAVAGKYDDIIVENEIENVIDGKGGKDIVYAMDPIDNYLLIRDNKEEYTFININNNNEKNTLKNIEFIIYPGAPSNTTIKLDETENVMFPDTRKGVHIKIKK